MSNHVLFNKENIPLSTVKVKLLQGHIQVDDHPDWEVLLANQIVIDDYFNKIGLHLHLHEAEGYAFLRSTSTSGEATISQELPSLVRKIPLSYEMTLLYVLLRKELYQFDREEVDNHRCIIGAAEIYELLQPFYSERNDETKNIKRFDTLINRAKETGILKELKGHNSQYEIMRIINALIGASELEDTLILLKNHSKQQDEGVKQ